LKGRRRIFIWKKEKTECKGEKSDVMNSFIILYYYDENTKARMGWTRSTSGKLKKGTNVW
jgi:hypothetical protein